MGFSLNRSDFPHDFIFGVATAAYQIEGTSFGSCGPSHWDSFAATAGNVVNGDDGSIACEHYHRYAGDLDLVRQAGFDAYRFSTSWSRVMPDGRMLNEEGLDFYDRLVDATLARDLKPCLTLYHWDLPSVLADRGGWQNRDIAGWFSDYAEAVVHRLGDRLFSVATINEPWCVAWLSHFIGAHAPGLRDIRAASRAMHHVLLAHAQCLATLRSLGQNNLGIVLNMEHANPASQRDEDIAAASRQDGIYNRWFIEALSQGQYPADILQALEPYMPANHHDDMAAICALIDWLGLNYYTRSNIAHDPNSLWPHLKTVPGQLPKTDMDWEIYPRGLHQFLCRIQREYTGELPIIVTENGMAGDDQITSGVVDDTVRVDYFTDHLEAVHQALSEGVPVKGYMAWSLLDNYEWAYGYGKRFGLVHVDYETQRRLPKASYYAFQTALNR